MTCKLGQKLLMKKKATRISLESAEIKEILLNNTVSPASLSKFA